MAQNIYDRPAFFDGYSQLPRSVHGLEGAPEWPDIRALIPDLGGKRVLDLGCGFGWFSRWAVEHGAASTLGFDLSEKMLARARDMTTSSKADYRIADLETLELPTAGFDFAYSSLAFHYVADFERLARVVHDSLRPGSGFVFSIEHPIYMAPSNPGWQNDKEGRRIWPVDRYSVEGERTTDWLAKGVVKYHRTLGTTLNSLIDVGFVIRRVVEWSPTEEQLTQHSALAEERDRPMMVIISAWR
ncbi:class I SAM-dependent methyltransferase [Labrys neptuniae]